MANAVFYSVSPYGAGSSYDLKNGSPTLTISSGVATLSVAQTENIGAGCHIDFDDPSVHVYIAPNRIGFDSGGTTELKVGDKIEGNSSGATGIVRVIEVTSGSWAGGDAAGYIYFSTTSGTWQDNEQINRTKPSTSNNICTADGTLQGNIGNGNTQFVVKTALGADASDVGSSETVNYIYHEYSSISGHEAGFTDANHINDTDLTSADMVVLAPWYYDHDNDTNDTSNFTVNFDGSDADNYYHMYTPIGGAESINNQRHDGKFDDSVSILKIDYSASTLNELYTRFEGFQYEFTNSSASIRTCFSLGTDYLYIYDNIFKGVITGTAGSHGIYAYNVSYDHLYFFNNIVQDFINGAYVAEGIYLRVAASCYVYNNTVHNCYDGIVENGGDYYIKNNIVNDCSNSTISGSFDSSSGYNIIDDAPATGAFGTTHKSGTTTGDGSGTGKLMDSGGGLSAAQIGSVVAYGGTPSYTYVTAIDSDTQLSVNTGIGNGVSYTIYTNMYGDVTFESEGTNDFHLGSGDTLALDQGTDLSSDGNCPFWWDIDGEDRESTWSVGADEYISAVETLTILGTVQSNLSAMPAPQLNLLLNPINTVLDELASVLTLPTAVETLTILNAVCDYLAEKPELQRGRAIDLKSAVLDKFAGIVELLRGRIIDSQDAVLDKFAKIVTPGRGRAIDSQDIVLDEFAGIVELMRERIVNPKSAVHDQLANIVTILALKSLAIQSAIHDQLAGVTDLTKESTLAIKNALHEQFATILTLVMPGVIDLVVQSALHSDLAKKANFSIAMLLRPQAAVHEQKVLTEVLQLLQKLTAQSAYHGTFAEKATLQGIVLIVQNAVHDALSGKLDMARERLLDVDSAAHDLISNIPDLTTAYQLIVLDAVCSLIVGKPILTEEALIALYTYIAGNQIHFYTAKNQIHHYVAREYE